MISEYHLPFYWQKFLLKVDCSFEEDIVAMECAYNLSYRDTYSFLDTGSSMQWSVWFSSARCMSMPKCSDIIFLPFTVESDSFLGSIGWN